MFVKFLKRLKDNYKNNIVAVAIWLQNSLIYSKYKRKINKRNQEEINF